MVLWRDKSLLKIQELKKLRKKETHKNSTPQDGDTYLYSTHTNVQTYVSTLEHVQQTIYREKNNTTNHEENAELLFEVKC